MSDGLINQAALSMAKQGRIIKTVADGNAIGVVVDTEASLPLDERYVVQIGVIDVHAPCSRSEFQTVIEQLRIFVTEIVNG